MYKDLEESEDVSGIQCCFFNYKSCQAKLISWYNRLGDLLDKNEMNVKLCSWSSYKLLIVERERYIKWASAGTWFLCWFKR